MKTFRRTLRKITLGLALSLIGLVAVLVAINAVDEDLAPETKALLVPPQNPYRAEENIYLALLGITAPSGQSPVAYAQARLAEYERNLGASLKDPSVGLANFTAQDPLSLSFKGKVDCCQPLTSSVWKGMEGREAAIAKLLDDNSELYQRYLALHTRSGYYEIATPSVYVPFVYPPSDLRSLFLANFALRMKSGAASQQKAALADLERDIRTWRAMLVGDGSLVSKMIAIAWLQGDYLILADMIADARVDLSGLSESVDRMMTLLEQKDWKIGKAFAEEYRFSAAIMEQMGADMASHWSNEEGLAGEPPKWWERYWSRFLGHFFKQRATQNLGARAMLQVIKMADSDAADLNAARDAYSRWAEENLAFGPRYAYNPVGRILVGVATPAYETYPLRANDAAALQRLVKLGYEIRRQSIEARSIPTFMQQRPELATHPVSGQFFSWDADKSEIAMQPVGDQPKDRRFSIPVWSGDKAN
jgi:hypothetical protein